MASNYFLGTTSGDWTTATNWSLGVVPVAADDVYLTASAVDISSGLDNIDVLLTPSGVTVVPQGTVGATTYGYRIAALNSTGTTLASATVTTATGNAALTTLNNNLVSWASVNGATSYKVYGRTSGSELLITTLAQPTTSFNDTGVLTPAGALPAGNTTGPITLNSLTIDQSYTGKLGLAGNYLQINATTVTVGRAAVDLTAQGSSRLHLNGTFTNVNIIDTAQSSADAGFPPICLLGTITTLNIRSGRVGVAVLTPIETATVGTVNISQSDTASSTPLVTFGLVTLTTANIEAGKLVNKGTAAVTTVKVIGGEYRVENTSAHTTITVESGKCVYNGTGTITNLSVFNATCDFSNDPRAKTVTNFNIYQNAKVNLQTGVKGSVTVTNGITINGADLDTVTLKIGTDRILTLA